MPVSVYKRLKSRSFPSVFQAWSPAKISGVGSEDALARHDLVFHSPDFFGLIWDTANGDGAAMSFIAESVQKAAGLRDARLAKVIVSVACNLM